MHRDTRVRLFAGTSTETNRIPLVLFGMQNRTFGPYSATIDRILIPLMEGVWDSLGGAASSREAWV
jgi:hypothetical protein